MTGPRLSEGFTQRPGNSGKNKSYTAGSWDAGPTRCKSSGPLKIRRCRPAHTGRRHELPPGWPPLTAYLASISLKRTRRRPSPLAWPPFPARARLAVAEYIEVFYNRVRLSPPSATGPARSPHRLPDRSSRCMINTPKNCPRSLTQVRLLKRGVIWFCSAGLCIRGRARSSAPVDG